MNRSNRRHATPAKAQPASRGRTSATRSASPARVSIPPRVNEDGAPMRVLRLRRGAPVPGGENEGASRSQSARRARQERPTASGAQEPDSITSPATRQGGGPGAAGLRPRPRSQSTLRSRPATAVTFEDKVRGGKVPAGLRPQKRRQGRRLLDPHHQYHTVDRSGTDQPAVSQWEMIVTAPAGVRTNTGPAFSLAHPD